MLIGIKMKQKILTELGHSDRLEIHVNPGKKSIRMTYSLKPLHP